jgi:uncharacterized membrane protein
MEAAIELATAAVTLTVLDLSWINFVAPKALGLDYLATVSSIQGGAPAAGRPLGLFAYAAMTLAAWRGATGLAGFDGTPAPRGAAGAAEVGFWIYAVYDLTSTFLFKGWGVRLALTDIAWGTTAFGAAGAAVAAVRAWRAGRG